MRESLDLSIIIVNWHSARFVLHCIESIRRHQTRLAFEIIVVDNASHDGCERALSEHGEQVIYIQSEKNLGFAKANNLAFAASRGTSLLFLNPDTEILGSAIERLHDTLHQMPAAGAVGPKLLNRDGSLQTSCIQSFPSILNQVLNCEFLRRRTPLSRLWGMAPLYTATQDAAEVEVISGACLMLKRDVFQRVGRFSEDYFMYGEDADLCLKMRKMDLKSYYVPAASVVHYGGSSSGEATSGFSAMMTRESIWRFLRKWHGERYGECYRWTVLFAALFRLGLLGVVVPIQIVRARRQAGISSFCKWWSVLVWSVRRNTRLVIPG